MRKYIWAYQSTFDSGGYEVPNIIGLGYLAVPLQNDFVSDIIGVMSPGSG
jgi:hypothetical protein